MTLSLALAALQSVVPGGLSVTVTGVVALVLAVVALAGHAASGIYFLVKWNTMVQVMKTEIAGTNRELHGFRSEVKEDMAAIQGELAKLGEKADTIIELRTRIEGLAERLRRVEDERRRSS